MVLLLKLSPNTRRANHASKTSVLSLVRRDSSLPIGYGLSVLLCSVQLFDCCLLGVEGTGGDESPTDAQLFGGCLHGGGGGGGRRGACNAGGMESPGAELVCRSRSAADDAADARLSMFRRISETSLCSACGGGVGALDSGGGSSIALWITAAILFAASTWASPRALSTAIFSSHLGATAGSSVESWGGCLAPLNSPGRGSAVDDLTSSLLEDCGR